MTTLLDEAFEVLGRMPPDAQDDIARALLGMAQDEGPVDIEPEHAAAVREGIAQAERGEFSPLTPEQAIAAAFHRYER
ncbi:hypothetical protein [uncultured Enterovirga sp.]|uniref:hypothetical protein n=1 Tax=uncultured Enterovirga sp. TaxID=2026352 RepID=UPI0035CC8319